MGYHIGRTRTGNILMIEGYLVKDVVVGTWYDVDDLKTAIRYDK